jgi:glycosyltransferase involved in cell wall biosynthesis
VARELAKTFDAPVTLGHTVSQSFWSGVETDIPFQSAFHEGGSGRFWHHVPKPYAEFRVGQRFGGLDFDEDILLSTSVYSKWIVPEHDQYHLHYANAHPVHFYTAADSGFLGWLKRYGKAAIDQHYTGFCDALIANSEFTRQRMDKHYDQFPFLLNPPIRADEFRWAEPADPPYFVMIARLVPAKRVDVVARAFDSIDRAELRVVGDGPLRERLERMDGVHVIRNASDEAVERIVAESIGGIAFGELEHCGMTPKEVQAAGKPVVVPDEPNLRNHVVDGESGVVVPVSAEGVRAGVERVLDSSWDPERIESVAADWDRSSFERNARALVDEIVADVEGAASEGDE